MDSISSSHAVAAVPLGVSPGRDTKRSKLSEHTQHNHFVSEWERHHFTNSSDADSDSLFAASHSLVAPALPVSLPNFYARPIHERPDFESLTALRANVFERDLNLQMMGGEFDQVRALEVSPDRMHGEKVVARKVVRAQIVHGDDENCRDPFSFASPPFEMNRRKIAAKNRAKLVCISCHVSKTKCYGGFPCQRCLEYDRHCEPRTRSKKRGRPKVPHTGSSSLNLNDELLQQ